MMRPLRLAYNADTRISTSGNNTAQNKSNPISATRCSNYSRTTRFVTYFRKTGRTKEQEITRGRKRLSSRISRLNVKISPITTDGNCLFRAISHQLYGTENYHQFIRGNILSHIRCYYREYLPIFGSIKALKSYIADTSIFGSRGDELCLSVAAKVYEIPVMVITSSHDHWLHIYYPNDRSEQELSSVHRTKDSPAVVLAYLSPLHYDSVTLSKKGNKKHQVYVKQLDNTNISEHIDNYAYNKTHHHSRGSISVRALSSLKKSTNAQSPSDLVQQLSFQTMVTKCRHIAQVEDRRLSTLIVEMWTA